jgi:hypothetical protein
VNAVGHATFKRPLGKEKQLAPLIHFMSVYADVMINVQSEQAAELVVKVALFPGHGGGCPCNRIRLCLGSLEGVRWATRAIVPI